PARVARGDRTAAAHAGRRRVRQRAARAAGAAVGDRVEAPLTAVGRIAVAVGERRVARDHSAGAGDAFGHRARARAVDRILIDGSVAVVVVAVAALGRGDAGAAAVDGNAA